MSLGGMTIGDFFFSVSYVCCLFIGIVFVSIYLIPLSFVFLDSLIPVLMIPDCDNTGIKWGLESWFDDFVSFKSRDHDIEDPETDEDAGSDRFNSFWSAEFAANSWITSDEQDHDGHQSFNTENGNGETQTAGFDIEGHSF